MTGIEAGHIVIPISAEIWQDMKAEFDRVKVRSFVISIWYHRQLILEVIRTEESYTCRSFRSRFNGT